MDDLLGLVVLIVFYLIAANSRKKRKQNKAARKAERASQQPWAEIRTNISRAMDSLDADRKKPQREQSQKRHEQAEPCQTQSIHLHEATQEQMLGAFEGEDPCHEGDSKLRTDTAQATNEEEDTHRAELAQDLLRGVIMSEILTRPCERTVRTRMKRGA